MFRKGSKPPKGSKVTSCFLLLLDVLSVFFVSHVGGLEASEVLGLAGFGEFALQEHSGDTKALLLVDRLSQDVVVGDGL